MIQDLKCQDTIAALATAVEGAVAIVRISGPAALALRDQLCRPLRDRTWKTAEFRLCEILAEGGGQVLDRALVVGFAPGRSYTGEATVELHIHGGEVNSRRVMDRVLQAGARQAEPGEFSFRAYASGRMDLCQAEAVQQIVGARAQAELDMAQRALRGSAAQTLEPLVQGLTGVLASVEVALDFPDDVEPVERESLHSEMQTLCADITCLLQGHQVARRQCELPRIALVGPPNVGKSSLFNLLCHQDRAITHTQPGTTRDPLEGRTLIDDRDIVLIDTAGLRETTDPVEQIAVQRSRRLIDDVDLCVWLYDASLPPPANLSARVLAEGEMCVLNKCDLDMDPAWAGLPFLRLSARTGEGSSALRTSIRNKTAALAGDLHKNWPVVLRRHVDLLSTCQQALQGAEQAHEQDRGDELVATDLRRALVALEQILGRDLDQQVLQTLFDRFCVGK